MKFLFNLLSLTLIILYVPKFTHSQTDGFTLPKIRSNLPYHEEWATQDKPLEPLEPIFQQKFTYLGSGGQSYVFASEDGNYVIKFFKHYRMRLHPLIDHIPLPKKLSLKREVQRAKRLKKQNRDFGSYKLAFEHLKEETALIYIHLNHGEDLGLVARIVDRLNIEHKLRLDDYTFLLQKKGCLAYPYLDQLEERENKKAIALIKELVKARCNKGIYDEDAKIHRNVGFIDGHPFFIDVGRLKYDDLRKETKVQNKDLKKILAPLMMRYGYKIS